MPKWTKSQVAELRKWMQDSGTSVEKLADLVSETPKRIKDRLSTGKYQTISYQFMDRLYQATTLDSLNPGATSTDIESQPRKSVFDEKIVGMMVDLENRLGMALELIRKRIPEVRDSQSPLYLKEVRDRFYDLFESLETLKQAPEKDIQRFRELIPPIDAGYLVSFINAIYSDSSFKQFVKSTAYIPQGGRRKR